MVFNEHMDNNKGDLTMDELKVIINKPGFLMTLEKVSIRKKKADKEYQKWKKLLTISLKEKKQ